MQNQLKLEKVDVLLSRITVPLSQDNPNHISILSEIPKLKMIYPKLKILVILSFGTTFFD